MIDETLRRTLETRVARLEQQITAFKELHATELGLILDELASLRADLAAMAPPPPSDPNAQKTDPDDPAAASPKRAAWLAEQERAERERRAPLTRRELLRGKEGAPGEG